MTDLQEYNAAKKQLFHSLVVFDNYVDGIHRPQQLNSLEWTQFDSSPGLYIKNITLLKPDNFAIALLFGIKGTKQSRHKLTDTVEMHCITGKVRMNNLEFRPGDRFKIPAGELYSFEFLEDTYLTSKFIPVNPLNFKNHEEANDESKRSHKALWATGAG
jgi:hypothetical protein